MALSNFSATEQRIIKLLSATLNAAPTPDLLEELAFYADAGVSAEVLLGVAFNNSVVAAKYPALKDGGDTAAFLSTFVENAAAGTDVSTTVKAGWKAALIADYNAYAEAEDATDAGFAIWLLDILATSTFPAGSDLAKVQAELAARAEEAGTQIAASTQTYDPTKGWTQFEIGGDTPPVMGDDIDLEVGRDLLTGTADNDTFWADLVGNLNTLESGDRLDGGNGIDTLVAQIGNSQDFAINPTLANIEKVLLSAQTTTADKSDNNIGSPVLLEEIGQLLNALVDGLTGGFDPEAQASLLAKLNGLLESNWRGAQFDGGSRGSADNQRGTVGVNHWESNNSRADLIVEDVRILDSQITKDITVAFVESDPGNVDFGLYFDIHSLRKESGTQTTALTLSVYNPLAVADGFDPANPLEDVPYDQLTILVNGNPITVSFDLTGVTTYDEFYAALVDSFTVAFDTYPELAGGSIQRLVDTKSFFSVDGQLRTADEFVLTLPNNTLTPATIGWNASQGLPSDNAFAANVQQGTPVVTENLITSTIILDDVGRGSTGGDLVIGGLSTGETSGSRGVEQFDITVERSSKLQSIASTNNWLEVVNIKSGEQYNEVDNTGSWTGDKYGDLTVLGSVDVTGYGSYLNKYVNLATGDIGLPGAVVEEATGFGLVDVREVDASEFQGNLSLSVLLTNRVAEKYLDLKDDPFNPSEDDIEFEYTLGSGNDVFALEIAKDNFITGGTTVYNDFDLVIDGGAGNDTIFARVGSEGEGADDLANWYLNSKLNANLAIAAGAGDDVVRTEESGDWFVDLGAGNDTYYADNSGDKALWVFNGAYNGGNIASAVNNNAVVVSGTFTVTATRANGEVFTAEVDVDHAAGRINDLHINQVIKDAINNDAVLGKLLEASDGPAFALVVESLIDGEWTDISFSFAGNALDAADLTAFNRANGTTETLAGLQAAQDAFVAAFGVAGDYLAANPAGDLTGTDSLNFADNTVNGGAGNDVIVLGTGASSSDVVVYTGVGNGVDTIVNFITGAVGVTEYTADAEGNTIRGTDVVGTNVDVIDLVSYNAIQAPIDGVDDTIAETIAVLDGFAAGNYIVIKDVAAILADAAAATSYTAESLTGEYLVEVYSVNAAGDATRTGTIAELDFNGAWTQAEVTSSIFWTA